ALLQELSFYPYSSENIGEFKVALACIRARFASSFSRKSLQLLEDKNWDEYRDRVSEQEHYRDAVEVSPPLRHLAQGLHLETCIVEEYLTLLRESHPKYPIVQVCRLSSDFDIMRHIQSIERRPAMLPVQDGNHWLFAALYSDIVHWYDSRPGSVTPARLAANRRLHDSTGPLQKEDRPEDSGLFMLLGLRLVANRHAHVSQKEADMISNFRTRVLVELLSKKLDPGAGEFDQLLRQEDELLERLRDKYEEQSQFFDDATAGMGLQPRQFTTYRQALPTPPPSQDPLEGCKIILKTVCDAVRLVRSVCVGKSTELAVLWSCIDRTAASEYHRRYNGALFYDKLEQYKAVDGLVLETEHGIDQPTFKKMKKAQPKYKFWRDLYHLHEEEGLAKYKDTLLCFLEECPNEDEQDETISEARRRLSNPADPLGYQLEKATKLCRAIMECNLPKERLMIEEYPYRAQYPLTDELYGAFLSLDPRPKVSLPRTPGR
ncbi:hypothetical protein S7711_11618, partial [Stachybotrys chartarum IBT 7711]